MRAPGRLAGRCGPHEKPSAMERGPRAWAAAALLLATCALATALPAAVPGCPGCGGPPPPLQLRIAPAGPSCGFDALTALLLLEGHNDSPAQVRRALGGSGEGSFSFANLVTAAKALGLPLVGRAGSLAELAPYVPFIAQVIAGGNPHFAVVEAVGPEYVRLLDAGQVGVARRSDFEQACTGRALTPALRPARTAHLPARDLGRIWHDRQQQVTLTWTNEGPRPVRFRGSLAPAGCTVRLPAGPVSPGEQAAVTVRFRPGPQDGGVSPWWLHLLLKTDDPDRPRQLVSVLASVIPTSQLIPDALNFGRHRPGELVGASRRLVLRRPADTRIWETASSTCFEAQLGPATPDGELLRHEITVRCTQAPPPGDFEQWLVIATSDPAQPELRVPLRGAVTPPLEAVPGDLFFGAVAAGSSPSATATLVTDPPRAFAVERIEAPAALAVQVLDGDQPGRRRLQVTLHAAGLRGVVQGELVLHTDVPGAETLRVPYYGHVLGE